MTKASDVASAQAVVNDTTAALLGDKDISKHISAPLVTENAVNPLEVSPTSGPLDYFPTLESRDVPPPVADGNESTPTTPEVVPAAGEPLEDTAPLVNEDAPTPPAAVPVGEPDTSVPPPAEVAPSAPIEPAPVEATVTD